MTDVVVVGGGIIGLATARALCLRGVRVTVLERGLIASGTSSRGEGNMLVSDKELGAEAALAVRSLVLWRRFAEESSVPFEFEEKGGIVTARTDRQLELLREQAQRQEGVGGGIRSTVLGATDLREAEPNLDRAVIGGIAYPQDAQVMPIQAVQALGVAASQMGAEIRTGVTVTGHQRRRGGSVLHTSDGEVFADHVVNAAGPWAGAVARALGGQVPVFPRRGLLLVTERVPAGTVRHKVYDGRYVEAVGSDEAAAQVAPVIESTRSGTILIGSTREAVGWDRSVPWELVGRLAQEAQRLFPCLNDRVVIRAYQGFRPATPDHLPLIGPDVASEGLYHHTGHEGAGIGLALGSAELLADAVMDGRVASAFDPRRFERSRAEDASAQPGVATPADDGTTIPEAAQPIVLRAGDRGADEARRRCADRRDDAADARQTVARSASHSRSMFCAIGHCFACVEPNPAHLTVRTCLTTGEAPRRTAENSSTAGRDTADGVRGCLVIGAGPGGMTAATWAARSGVDVLMIDRYPRPGGQIARQPDGHTAPAVGPYAPMIDGLPEAVEVWGGAEVSVLRQVATGWQAVIVQGGVLTEIIARTVVIATGAREVVAPFPGWTMPGVMTVGGVQARLKREGAAPARRIGLAGTGPLLLAVAAALSDAGTAPQVVAELQPLTRLAVRGAATGAAFPSKVAAFGRLTLGGVTAGGRPPRFGWRVAEAVGTSRLRAVVLEKAEDPRKRRSVALDLLGVSHALIPDIGLATSVGCATRPAGAGPAVVVDTQQQTTVPRIYAVGEVTGVGGADKSVAEGYVAGMVIGMQAGTAGDGSVSAAHGAAGTFGASEEVRAQAVAEAGRWRMFADRLAELYPFDHGWSARATADTIVCRCESVPLGDIREAVAHGATTPRAVKGLTRCGMGYCQGNVCGPLLGSLTRESRSDGPAPGAGGGRTGLESRPLAVPVPLRELARVHDPAPATDRGLSS